MKYAILIPCYNHGQALIEVINSLQETALPILIVNDGSDANTSNIIDDLASKFESVSPLHLPENSGKGGAVMAGIKHLQTLGFSHAIQVDADGQHDLKAIPELLKISQRSPDKLVSGAPIYGDSVPKARLYGRYATHVSVWISTLSFEIKDSMIGFRAYPIEMCCALFSRKQLGTRMDFDTEILVRLYWQGVDIEYLPVNVHYPENGISHFSGLKDNLRISWLHTRLITEMFIRSPQLLKRNWKRNVHWSRKKENGSILGMKALLWSYKVFGRSLFKSLLYPVILYYYLTDHKSRNASKQFQLEVAKRNNAPIASSYRHLFNFGEAMLDKLAAWMGQYSVDDVVVHNESCFEEAIKSDTGCLILGSHLGNLEACRALSERYTGLKMNAIVFTQHAEKFNSVMESVNKDSSLNLIQVTDLGPDTAILLEQKLNAGEWVVIVGDRTPVTKNKRVVWSDFMGKQAPFPLGPFILASILKHPTYAMFGFCFSGKIEVHLEPLPFQPLVRGKREQGLQTNVAMYASILERYALRYPLQWFNFYDFWKLDNE
ncbi:glycosyltransferase family 2 protein [Vibrio sp. WJH972]